MIPVPSGTIKRVGLIGDVHGADEALRQALAFLATQPDLDAILCTGDLPLRQGNNTEPTARCCQMLAEAGVITVRGNHDRWHVDGRQDAYPADAFAFLAALPPSRSFQTPHGLVLLCHGVGDDDMNGVYRNAGGESRDRWLHLAGLQKLEVLVRHYPYRLIISGHTHLFLAEQHGEAFLINGGTLLADKEPPTVSVIDFEAGWVRFYQLELATATTRLVQESLLP
jgi:putative phosphoesterase